MSSDVVPSANLVDANSCRRHCDAPFATSTAEGSLSLARRLDPCRVVQPPSSTAGYGYNKRRLEPVVVYISSKTQPLQGQPSTNMYLR